MQETPQIVARVYREEFGRLVAGLIGLLQDFDLAEEAAAEAYAVALERWPVDGVPDRPGAWLTTVARNRARDRLRRRRTADDKAGSLAWIQDLGEAERQAQAMAELEDPRSVPDERLRLIFTCCHPSLAKPARVALTLRTLGGLSTVEIARAFLVPEATMAQRLVRAKKRIAAQGIPYEVPPPEQLGARLDSVLRVLYLIFNEGYAATAGDALVRVDLCGEAIRLVALVAELVVDTVPDTDSRRGPEAEALGLHALMLLHHSRRAARVDGAGDIVLLEDQDRSRWDRTAIDAGLEALDRALERRAPGPYQIQAAIAALHARAPTPEDTDWAQIAALYAGLMQHQPSPVVELNAAVAAAMADGPERGLELLARLEQRGDLAEYHLLPAAQADLLRRAGRASEARVAYERALSLARNAAERRFLSRRIDELS